MRYVVSYPRLSRMTRRNGTTYFRFCVLEGRAAVFFRAAAERTPFFLAAALRALLVAAARAGRAAGRLARGRAAGAGRGAAVRAFGSGARVAYRGTRVKRI